jgi:hypothetical protein
VTVEEAKTEARRMVAAVILMVAAGMFLAPVAAGYTHGAVSWVLALGALVLAGGSGVALMVAGESA